MTLARRPRSGPSSIARRIKGKEHAALEPESMRDYLLTHPLSRGGRLWCDRIIEGVDKNDRTSVVLFAQAMRWVGAEQHIGIQIVQQLGAPVAEAREAVARLRESAAKPLAEIAEDAATFLRWLAEKHPVEYAALWAALPEPTAEARANVLARGGEGGQNGPRAVASSAASVHGVGVSDPANTDADIPPEAVP